MQKYYICNWFNEPLFWGNALLVFENESSAWKFMEAAKHVCGFHMSDYLVRNTRLSPCRYSHTINATGMIPMRTPDNDIAFVEA